MTAQTSPSMRPTVHPSMGQWLTLGITAAVAAIVGVIIVQFVALAVWPDAALFQPLDSYVRSAIFTLVPALIATALFAWLARRRADPARTFLWIAVIVLVLSFIPDYVLPDPNRTFTASTIAAALHVVAAAIIVPILIRGYRRMQR